MPPESQQDTTQFADVAKAVEEHIALKTIRDTLKCTVHKVDFFSTEHIDELHQIPESLESCHRWVCSLLDFVYAAIDPTLNVPEKAVEMLEELHQCLATFLQKCDSALEVDLGLVKRPVSEEECRRRLQKAGRIGKECLKQLKPASTTAIELCQEAETRREEMITS